MKNTFWKLLQLLNSIYNICRGRKQARGIFLMLIVALLMTSCAQMVPLTGGQQDTQPPRLIKSSPENKSTSFQAKEFQLEFDEYIQLSDIMSQLIITPRLKEQPIVTTNGKTLTFKFKEALKDSTTYCINFGNAIADIHEGNKLSNFTYLFSTGDKLDSLKLEGQLTNAFTLEPVKEAWVMLYLNKSDSVIYKEKPDYIGKTNSVGNYEIKNIKKGTYKVLALKDDNKNFMYDEGELMGFTPNPLINIKENQQASMMLFKENPGKVYLKSNSQPNYGKVLLVFNTAVDTIRGIEVINKSKSGRSEQVKWNSNTTKDTVQIFYQDLYTDTLLLKVSYNKAEMDSCNIQLLDKEDLKKMVEKRKINLEYTSSCQTTQVYPYYKPLSFKFNRSLKEVNAAAIRLSTSGQEIPLETVQIRMVLPDSVYIDYKLMPGLEYNLKLLPGAFTDVLGIKSDSMTRMIKTADNDYYSSLTVNLKMPQKQHGVLQLYNSKGLLQAEKKVYSGATAETNGNKIIFKYLLSDTYTLKFIQDDDDNGKYTSGNYKNKLQPEKVYYYQQVLKVLENWELEVEWKL